MDVYQRRRLVALSALAALFIIVVLLIRSCGGDDESTTPLTTPIGTSGAGGATPLTHDDLVAQGDAICLETNSTLAGIDTSDPDQAAADSAEVFAGELNSLQSLSLASGEKGETKLENFLTSLQKQVQAYDERSVAAERGDETAVAEIDAKIEDEAAAAQHAAENFGFKACGNTSKVSDSGSSGGTDTSGTDTATTTVAPTTTTPVTPTTPAPTTPTDTGGGTAPPTDGTDTGDGSSSGSGGLTP